MIHRLFDTRLAASVLAAGFAASLALGHAEAANAAESGAAMFQLTAEGQVELAPDMASVQLGVVARGGTAAQAMALNRVRMAAVVAALKAAGLGARDIQTSGLSLTAQYEYPQNQPARLIGYEASNRVNATVRDIGRVGAVVDAVTAAGANQISGVSFDIADRHKAEDDARRAAVQALSDKAALYAQATGLHEARLVSLSEGDAVDIAPPPRMMAMARMAAPAAPPTDVEPGELRVRITISGVYQLTR